MESLRRYILTQTELETYIGQVADFDLDNLIRAERDIDKVVATFGEGVHRPHLFVDRGVYSAVLTSTTATIADFSSSSNGFYQYSAIEILEGANKGTKIAVQDNTAGVLTFFDTQTGLSETSNIRVFQEGKFPMYKDVYVTNSTYYKTIPEFLKECVALQYAYRLKEGDNLYTEQVQSGYTVSQDSYSENFDNSLKKTIRDRISPEALDILDSYGLTLQTL